MLFQRWLFLVSKGSAVSSSLKLSINHGGTTQRIIRPIAVFEVLSPEDTVVKIRRNWLTTRRWGFRRYRSSIRRMGRGFDIWIFEEPSLGISFRIEEIGKRLRR
jgi:hypothetical protein